MHMMHFRRMEKGLELIDNGIANAGIFSGRNALDQLAGYQSQAIANKWQPNLKVTPVSPGPLSVPIGLF